MTCRDWRRSSSIRTATSRWSMPLRSRLHGQADRRPLRESAIPLRGLRFAERARRSTRPSRSAQRHHRYSNYAAFYYPWIFVSDPRTGARKTVPPGGHVLGVYARTDIERGVFKAPANEIVRGALDLEYDINDQRSGHAEPARRERHPQLPRPRHPRLGRAHAHLERAVEIRQRAPAVHLPRALDLRRHAVGGLRAERRPAVGAREGHHPPVPAHAVALRRALRPTEEEAFFITCDRTTMTQDDILNGRLICEIGIAPVRPAEFVIFRIFQNTAEAQR